LTGNIKTETTYSKKEISTSTDQKLTGLQRIAELFWCQQESFAGKIGNSF